MNSSLRALLSGIIDYAGLFPPAQLELEPAFRNYLSYRHSPEAWMLGRFVCPAARLPEMIPLRDAILAEADVIHVSGLGRGGADRAAFEAGLAQDLAAINASRTALSGRVAVDVFETRLPTDVLATGDAAAITAVLDRLRQEFASAGMPDAPCFVEMPIDEHWRRNLQSVLEGIEHLNTAAQRPAIGFKLRTGGLEAKAFPTSEQIAEVISACAKSRVPLKCTAGLHHPIRRFDPGVRTHMHGFVNVFGAAVLAGTLPLTLPDVLAIVDEQDARNFRFDDETFAWNEAEATVSEIEFARRSLAISLGSCSFDEPRDDLRLLGWLPRPKS